MKLLLTSSGLTNPTLKNKFLELAGKNPERIKLAFIPTAAGPETDKSWIEQDMKPLQDLNISFQEIDIKKWSKENLAEELDKYDVIWVNGGNTFYLLYWMKQSGFYEIVRGLLEKSKLYVGVSAGSIAAGETIETSNWKGYDDPSIVSLDNYDGLKLVDFSIFVHDAPKWRQLVSEKKHLIEGELICLKDNQAIVITDGKRELLTG